MHCTRTWRASSVVKKLNNSNLAPPKNLKIWNSAGNYFNPPLFELIVYSKKGLDHFGGTMTEIISWPSLSSPLLLNFLIYGTHSFGQSLRGYLEDLDCVRFPVWWPNVRGKTTWREILKKTLAHTIGRFWAFLALIMVWVPGIRKFSFTPHPLQVFFTAALRIYLPKSYRRC